MDIKPEHFADLFDIINDFDSATLGEADKQGNQGIVLSKDGVGLSFTVVSERGTRKAEVVTFYKRKKKKAPRMSDAQSPEQNVQNDSGRPPSSVDSSIPQQKTKRNEKIGSLLIGKTGRKFTATQDRSLDESHTKDLATLAENPGGKREGEAFSFKTARDRDAFTEVANAYIGLLDEMNSGKASATEDIERTQKIVRSMRIIPQKSLGKQANMLASLGEAMGCPVVWVDADSSLNGVYHGNVAFLNRNAGMDITKTFWHEQFHWIKANNEALYKELLSYFKGRKRFTKDQIDRFRRDTGRHSLGDDAVIEEILADEFMDVSKRIPMLREMAGEKPTLAQRFVAWVKRMMDRVAELFHNPDGRFTTAQRDAFVEGFGKLAGSMKDSKGRPLFKTYQNGRRITLANGDSLLSKLLDMVKNPLQDIAGIKLSAAWHGSPHEIDRLSVKHIGTGEGSQVHGWGLYFAKERSVSEGYREVLRQNKNRILVDGKKWEERTPDYNSPVWWAASSLKSARYSAEKAVRILRDAVRKKPKGIPEAELDAMSGAVDLLETRAVVAIENPGSLLQVEIPDEDVMLDEQKNFEEQPEKVQKALTRLLRAVDAKKSVNNRFLKDHETTFYGLLDAVESDSAEEKLDFLEDLSYNGYITEDDVTEFMSNHDALIRRMNYHEDRMNVFRDALDKEMEHVHAAKRFKNLKGKAIYSYLAKKLTSSDKAASELLNEHGIKGITYEGGRDGRCYVVFDDDSIEITARFSVNLSEDGKKSVDNSEKVGDNKHKVSRKFTDIPYQTQEYVKNVLKNKGLIHRITSADDVDSICDKVISPLKDAVETLLDRYLNGRTKAEKQRMLDTAALYVGMVDETRRVFNEGGSIYHIISESGLVRERARAGSPLAKSLEARGRQIAEARKTGKEIGVKIADAVDGFSEKHQPIVDAIRTQDRGDGIKFSLNLNSNTNEHSGNQGASSMSGMQETSRKWMDGIADTFAKKLHLKGDRIITEEREKGQYEDITLKQYLLNSPSRIADKVQSFRLFFRMGDRAMDKLTKLRSDYQRKYDKAMKTAASRQNTHIRRLQRKASRISRNSARGI